ncbi:hypothetical protein DOTSEDRAFT_54259 [Dothistroma septosporum NZE10]|uniref:Uncharacterized protein n=1 Tax=Dothistroma septosporum (strain NZE10 / CBS 128990) TaxID=675120 RepID=M2YP91_DOTSN|nr:hypothetical protein DOTSEDRAFT_54259 [Dothistroma septosporum NZE10]
MVSTRNSIAAKPSPEQEPAKATPVKKDRTRAVKIAKDGEQGTPAKATEVEAKLKSKRAKRRSRVAVRMKAEGLSRRGAAKTETNQEEGKNDES